MTSERKMATENLSAKGRKLFAETLRSTSNRSLRNESDRHNTTQQGNEEADRYVVLTTNHFVNENEQPYLTHGISEFGFYCVVLCYVVLCVVLCVVLFSFIMTSLSFNIDIVYLTQATAQLKTQTITNTNITNTTQRNHHTSKHKHKQNKTQHNTTLNQYNSFSIKRRSWKINWGKLKNWTK